MAQILSVSETNAIKGENYLIDTNVWFWFTYASSKGETLPNQPSQYQIEHYPKFIENILEADGKPCHTSLMLTELANVIERTEFELFKSKNNTPYLERKDFRKQPAERAQVLEEIETAWDTINQISRCIDCKVDKGFIDKSFKRMSDAPLDPYDAIYIEVMDTNRIDYIVTDDIDFSFITKLILITANPKGSKKHK